MSYFNLRPSLRKGLGVCGAALVLMTSTLPGPSALASNFEPSFEGVEAAVSAQQEGPTDPEANLPYLFAVFLVTWGAFFGYLIYIARRQKDMRREIDALRADFARKDGELDEPQERGAE